MHITHKKKFSFFLFIAILLTSSSDIAFSNPVKKLYIVHSYEQGHICGQPQHEGAMKAISDSGWKVGENLDLAVYYMDTKRKNNTPELIREQAEKAVLKIEKFKPDVVLTLDDNAFKNIAATMAETSLNIVFSGMNGQPEMYNKSFRFMKTRENPGYNITGVYEKLHIREAIKVLSKLLELKKVLILDDLSPTGKAIKIQVELELDPARHRDVLPCDIEKKTIKTWEEYKYTIEAINSDPDIGAFYLGTLLLKDAAGKTYTANEIISYTVKNSKKPAIGLNYAFIKMGLYGGASVDFYAMGYLAGTKVSSILNGEDPGEIPIEDAERVALVFNLSRAEALGLKIPNDILLSADEVFRK